MKVFISSVIAGYETYRDAAAEGIKLLKHDAIRAEDFSASPDSPQKVCLRGVRDAEVVVVVVGARYGYIQESGLSATHEELLEARQTGKPILVLVQQGVDHEAQQKAFLGEIREWTSGLFTASFSTPDELRLAVIKALHDLESPASPVLDEGEMRAAANRAIDRLGDNGERSVCLAVVGWPVQQVLRPAALASGDLHRKLHKEAVFGPDSILSDEDATRKRLEDDVLIISQSSAAVAVSGQGAVSVLEPAHWPGGVSRDDLQGVLIEEHIREGLARSLRFVASILDIVDPARKLSRVFLLAAMTGAKYCAWRTLKEHAASPNSVSFALDVPDRVEVVPKPGVILRTALRADAEGIADDITVLLRQRYKS